MAAWRAIRARTQYSAAIIDGAQTVSRAVSSRGATTVGAAVDAPAAAYVHLPFCKKKCFYCDFPVEAVGLNINKTRTQDRIQTYVDLVCAEIKATRAVHGQQPLETVSFGGGTPSLVPPHLLELILQTLQQQYGISITAEISLEADPGTFDVQRLLQYKALGVNRLSMGVQCFQEELLQTCGRSHTLSDVHAAVDAVKAADMASWSLDLISGLPKLTKDVWRDSLRQAIAARPDHISVYDLQIEEGTPFDRWYSGGSTGPLPREPEAVEMFELASSMLTAAGYEHYEISNYAKPGHRSRHNQVYWKCQPYYAFGLGAASYVQGKRFTRPKTMKAYEQWLQEYVQSDTSCPAAHLPQESKEEQLLDQIMLSLRLQDGLSLQRLQADYGPAVVGTLLPAVHRFLSNGLMQLTTETMRMCDGSNSSISSNTSNTSSKSIHAHNGLPSADCGTSSSSSSNRTGAEDVLESNSDEAFAVLQQRLQASQPCGVRLTDPAGFLLSNDIISDLFAELEPATLSAATS